jgi:hypothetical protein
MAEKYRKLMDNGDVRSLREGFLMDSVEVGITVNGMRVTSHILHQIRMHIQGSKHCKYLQGKHKWDNATLDSIDWKGLKSGFLSLGPLKNIKTSRACMDGSTWDDRSQRSLQMPLNHTSVQDAWNQTKPKSTY